MKKHFLKTVFAGAFLCAMIGAGRISTVQKPLLLPAAAAADTASCCDFDAETGTLTLRGEVLKSEVQTYASNKSVKSVAVEEGAVFPADCTEMFQRFYAESIDLSGADMSGVTDMSRMFMNSSIKQSLNLSGLNTSHVTNMSRLCCFCSAPSIELTDLDTSAVTSMQYMFSGCNAVTSLHVSGMHTAAVTDMSGMFAGCANLTSLNLGSTKTFHTGNVTDMSDMFNGCKNLKQLEFPQFKTDSVTNMSRMFSNCASLTQLELTQFRTGNVTDMSSMFSNCTALEDLNLSHFDTSNVTDMSGMFFCCYALKYPMISSFRTENVRNMSSMFERCTSLTYLDLSGFDTGKTENMSLMFHYCLGLKALDVSGFLTKNVKDMHGMFSSCRALVSLNLSGFDTANVTDMGNMFDGCNALTTLSVSSFNTANVTNMNAMFSGCRSIRLLDLSSFDTAAVKRMPYMFRECVNLETIRVTDGWTAENADEAYQMFTNCTVLTGENGTVYDKDHVDKSYAHIDNLGGPGYLSRGYHAGLDSVNEKALTGDLNGTGRVTIADAVMLARFCAEDAEMVISAQGMQNADCNKDGIITLEDIMQLLRTLSENDADRDGLLDADDPYPEEAFDRCFEVVGSYSYDPSIDFVDTRYKRSQLCHKRTSPELSAAPAALGVILGDMAMRTHDFTLSLWCIKKNLIAELAAQCLTVGHDFDWGLYPERRDIASDAINHASDALTHYFCGFGMPYIYSASETCEMISCSMNNLDHLYTNLTWTMKCAEQTLKDDSQIILATKSNSLMKAGCNVDRGAEDGGLRCADSRVDSNYQLTDGTYFNYLNRDWINTVGECGAAIVADISRNGDTYTMKYRYIFKDLYEWSAHYDMAGHFDYDASYAMNPTALHWFHEVGAAEEHLMRGEFEGELTWKAGQTAFDEGIFETVKQTVRNHVSEKAWMEGNEYDRFEQAIAACLRTPQNWQDAYDRIQALFLY